MRKAANRNSLLPRKIGIVTSPTGAAIRDMVSILRRRNPSIAIYLVPAIVQGKEGLFLFANRWIGCIRWIWMSLLLDGAAVRWKNYGASMKRLWCGKNCAKSGSDYQRSGP